MRAPQEKEKVNTETQEEPEQEPASPEEPEAVVAPEDVPEEADDDALPTQTYPTLEQYQERWVRRLAEHSKPVPSEFGRNNLVPEPMHQLW